MIAPNPITANERAVQCARQLALELMDRDFDKGAEKQAGYEELLEISGHLESVRPLLRQIIEAILSTPNRTEAATIAAQFMGEYSRQCNTVLGWMRDMESDTKPVPECGWQGIPLK